MSPDAPNVDARSAVRKVRDCLQAVDFLHQLKLDELDKLMEVLKKRSYPAGSTIIKEGEAGDAFFLILSGKVSVWAKGKQLVTRQPGEYFGESALVTDAPRSATVKSEGPTELYVLYKADFTRILMANPGIAMSIKAHVAKLKLSSK